MTASEKARKLILETDMLPEGSRVIAGVSGGADSVFLFDLLLEYYKQHRIELWVIHVHHGIRREEADRDAGFVTALCEKNAVPFKVVRRNIPEEARKKGLTLEEAGREARREIFRREAEKLGGAKIALAHHRDDLAETVLFRLARGTGIPGLAAMQPVREPYIRPLLELGREEIREELMQRGIFWVEDSSNFRTEAVRNRIRNSILPLLESEVNSGAGRHLAEIAKDAADLSAFLNEECRRRSENCVSREPRGILIRRTLLEEPKTIRTGILRAVLEEASGSAKDLGRGHVNDLLALFGRADGACLDLPYGVRAVKIRDDILLEARGRHSCPELPQISMKILDHGGQTPPQKRYTKWIDYDRIVNTIEVRTRREGDYLVIDSEGHKKSLSDYFTDNHVPLSDRDKIVLVADGREIVWVVGMRIGYRYRVTKDTRTVLCLCTREEQDE